MEVKIMPSLILNICKSKSKRNKYRKLIRKYRKCQLIYRRKSKNKQKRKGKGLEVSRKDFLVVEEMRKRLNNLKLNK
jgi:hypothetical protein